MTRLLRLLILLVVLLGCQTGLLGPRTRLDDEGEAYLYLQPSSQAARLSYTIETLTAVHADGREFALPVASRELKGAAAGRQKLLAAGALPAGTYAGFAVKTARATLRGDDGESAMLVPDTPTRIDVRFTIQRREATVLALSLRFDESVNAGFRFTPVFSVFNPDRPAVGLMGFVANASSDDVTVFNRRSLQVFDVIATGRGPVSMALDARVQRLYVALSGEDAVEVVDIQAGRIADRIRLTPGDEPAALALTPDGKTLLCANRGSNTVSVIDPVSRFELAKVPAGNGPRFVVIDPTGRRAFVFSTLSNSVAVLDIAGRGVIRTIQTDPGPVRGQFSNRGDRLYVVHEPAPYVTVINLLTLTVVTRLPVRAGTDTIAVDPSTDLVYLGGQRELTVGVYDPLSFATVGFIDTRASIAHMVTDREENTLYLVSPATNRVLVVSRIRRDLVGELEVGDGPVWISVAGEN